MIFTVLEADDLFWAITRDVYNLISITFNSNNT